MTRDDVRELMHDYFDGHLSEEECSRVRSFLEEYETVAEEYRRFNVLLERVKSLPSGFEIPKELTSEISEELLSLSVAEYESEKQRKLRELSEGDGPQNKRGTAKRYRSSSKRTVVPFSTKTIVVMLFALIVCIAALLLILL